MGIPKLRKDCLYIETGAWSPGDVFIYQPFVEPTLIHRQFKPKEQIPVKF